MNSSVRSRLNIKRICWRAWEKKINILKSFVIISCVLLGACSQTISWQEEVLLASGQKIVVDRSVKLISSEPGQQRPSIYEISAKNPATGKKLDWEGSHGLNPILLDFKSNKVFLVALPGSCDAKIKQFSVKGLPYIFMESDDGEKWETINPNQFPSEFKNANLSLSYDSYYVGSGNFQPSEQILKANEYIESNNSDGYFRVSIPRSISEWSYKGSYHEGCGR